MHHLIIHIQGNNQAFVRCWQILEQRHDNASPNTWLDPQMLSYCWGGQTCLGNEKQCVEWKKCYTNSLSCECCKNVITLLRVVCNLWCMQIDCLLRMNMIMDMTFLCAISSTSTLWDPIWKMNPFCIHL